VTAFQRIDYLLTLLTNLADDLALSVAGSRLFGSYWRLATLASLAASSFLLTANGHAASGQQRNTTILRRQLSAIS